jgi:hypothetical protein
VGPKQEEFINYHLSIPESRLILMPKALWSAFLLVRESLTFAESPNLNSDNSGDVPILSIEPAKNGAICMLHAAQEEQGIAKWHKILPTYPEPCRAKGASVLIENDIFRSGGCGAQTYLKGTFVQSTKFARFVRQSSAFR